MTTRRGFIVAAAGFAAAGAAGKASGLRVGFHAFSKNFQFLGREEFCELLAGIGMDGVEWCVRCGGHVEPSRVRREMPLAAKAAAANGLAATMIVTRFTGGPRDEADAVETLKVCADCGVKTWRPGSFLYDRSKPLAANVAEISARFRRLEEISRASGVRCTYQNHLECFGGGVFDLLPVLEGLDPAHVALQYDVMHAVFETPVSWGRLLKAAAPRIANACLKDCNALAELKGDFWKTFRTVPAPSGVVPFEKYARLLRELDVSVPHSVHYEIPLPKGDRKELADVMRKELDYFKGVFGVPV